MNTALEKLLSSAEGRNALCVEQTITNVTELLCKHLEQSGMTRSKLAQAMGVSAGRVTQLLDGNANLTLASIARALAAFDHVLEVSSSPVEKLASDWEPTFQIFGQWQSTVDMKNAMMHYSDFTQAPECPLKLAG